MPVHYMSCEFPLLVTAHADRLVHVWDLAQSFAKNDFDPVDVVFSELSYETSSIACFPDGKGFALGAIEGRVRI